MRTDGPIARNTRDGWVPRDRLDAAFGRGFTVALARIAALVVTLLLATSFAVSRQKPVPHEPAPPPAKPIGPNGQHPNPGFINKLRSLSPEEREKFLQNNRYFQSLPPWRQEQIRKFLNGNDQHLHPPGFFGQLRDLPPDQQEQVLQNDARFQSLPPERQQQIRENLQRWNAATPAQREMLRQREEIVQSLSPEQRDQLRQIFQRWRQLPNDRQQALTQSFVKLRHLPAQEREKYLSSPEVLQQFSSEERSLLSELGNLLPKN